MENCTIIKLKTFRIKIKLVLPVVLGLFGFLIFSVFAYSPYYTHPDLTEEIAKLFNLKNSNQDLKISQNEIQWMRQGAIDEDTPPRWINHFYDPIHKTGWSGKHFGTLSQADGLYQGESMSPKPVLASIDWVTNQEYQSAYGRQYGNQTWQKAIKSYIDGDKKSAFIAMGHILHLMEDASVPDHTRDDTHADLYGDPGSPYEKYAKEYTNFNKLNIAENLKSKELSSFSNIQGAFEYLANYSNNNFFSEDTISSEEFKSPNLKILKEQGKYLLDQKSGIHLAKYTQDGSKVFYTTNDESLILPSYFSHLAPQAVLTGASVMNLFFQEVEKYKKNPELLPQITPDSSESIVSYIGKAPRLAAVNVSDRCDRITTDYKINGDIINVGKEVGCSTILGIADAVDKTITNTQKIGIFAQGIIGNITSIFSKSKADIFSMTANIWQGASQIESRIANQESGILNQSAEVEPPNSKEVQPQSIKEATQIQSAEVQPPNSKEEVQPQKQPEIIHAPYQWSSTGVAHNLGDPKTEVIHAPYQSNAEQAQNNIEKIYKDNSPSRFENQQSSGISSVSSDIQSAVSYGGSTSIVISNQQSTGQGETPSTNTNTDQTGNTSQQTVVEDLIFPPAPDTTPPEKPIITTNNGQDFIIKKFASQYPERKINLVLEGTKSQDTTEILINNSSESVNYPTQTSWKKDFILPAGDNAFEIKAKDSAGNISESTIIKITLRFSDVKFYLTNYDVRKFNFTLNWQDDLSVANSWELQYKLGPNFDWADLASSSSLTANSYDLTAKYDDLTYYFRLRGSDANGNQTDWQYLQADISTKPVVINEVAWMGTAASYTDEWMELANKTDQEIDLKGWNLKSSYGNININLTGKIAPNSFYLLERTNDNPIANIQANQIYTGDLNNPGGSNTYGQVLTLSDSNNNQVDQTYAAWTGVNDTVNNIKKTSERVSIWSSGMERKNWRTYSGSGGDAQDASGNKILGTPKAKNSQADLYYYLLTVFSIDKDAIFSKNKGPYISDNLINISQPATLNIEPGTVLKFGYLGGLDVHGKLSAKGTTDNKIIFTSSDDDQYGGDTNGDGQTKIINWRKFIFNDGSSGEINNSLFRYAGNVWTTDNEVVYINKSSVKISGSVFENMGKDVLHFNNSDTSISNSEFKNNSSNAVYVYGGKGDIFGNVFDGNKGVGIYVGAPSGRINISGNSFTKNKAPIRLDSFGDFGIDLNQISNNNYNGILIYAPGLDTGKVLLSADMPFVIMGFPTIQSGATLEVAAGTIIKFNIADIHGLTINGALKAIGTAEKPIIFTSLYDDQYGGDTNNDGAATAPRPGLWAWLGFAGGDGSILENTIIKYGGQLRYSNGGPPSGGSGIYIESGVSNFVMRNSTISNSVTGMTVSGDGVIIENSTFSNNNLISDNGGMSWRGGVGLDIAANNITVSKVVFNNNGKAFQSGSAYMATILLSDLIFNQNTYNYWPENLMSQ